MDSPPQLHLNARSLGFHLQDQDSPSSQEVNCGKNLGQMKPMYLMGHPEAGFNIGQMDYNRAMGCMPYPCGDPYYNGILNTYGTTPIIQPHMMSMTTTRVPLPLDISEDEPIFVNAKQYHGILRRRQSRAKMEAQNKLIKARKPYLHESRHLHALNRVRGSGGRFLSTKKQQQSDSTSNRNHSISGSNAYNNMVFESHQSQCMATGTSSISTTNGNSFYQQQDGGFLGISSSHTGGAMQHNGGFINNPNQHQAPVVR
uniref:Nuclear transcription factor Y subunit n=1 Tax=Chenopodium quinoa TaxID=63459 RepID=A0A803M8E8_CHEQI